MTPSKISKAAQGTIEVIMRLALVICLPVSTQKQLFTFSNMVLCHLMLSLSPPPSLFISSSPSQPLSVSSSTFSPNHKCSLSLSPTLFFPHIFHFACRLSVLVFFMAISSSSPSFTAYFPTSCLTHNTLFTI